MEEKKREKRKKNLIISGLRSDETYEKEGIEKWIKGNLNTEVKVGKIWRVKGVQHLSIFYEKIA